MKGKLLTVVFSLIGLFVTVNDCYACPELPIVILDIDPESAFVGDTVTLDGSDSLPYIVKYEWDFGDGAGYSETYTNYPDGEFDGITTHEYDVRGNHTVRLTVYSDGYGDNFVEKTVDVKGVKNAKWPTGGYDSIQDAIDYAGEGDTIIVAPGTYAENLDFTDTRITLTSTEPDNPDVVARTIIDGSDVNNVIIFRSGNADSTITGFTITNGRAMDYSGPAYSDYGGGIHCDGVSPIISNCVITKNYARLGGGGIYCDGASPTITDCVFRGNSVSNGVSNGDGGGIHCSGGSPTISNCVITGNEAKNNGGGMYNYNSSPEVTNCVFTSNFRYSEGGAGIHNDLDSQPTLTNCILWANNGTSEDVQLYGGDPTVTFCCIQGWTGDGTGNISADPYFVNPSDPDGKDDVWATSDDGLVLSVTEPQNPCIDTGYNDAQYLPDTDIIGNDRTVDGDHDEEGGVSETVDMGPYEVPRIWFVDYDKNGNGKSWGNAYKHLQDALNNSNINSDDEIWVADGTYYPDEGAGRTNDLRYERFQLIEGVPIYGGFDGTEGGRFQRDWTVNKTILSGDIDKDDEELDDDNSYRVVKGKGANNARLDGFTIQDGYNETSSGSGAGMLIYDCESIYINNCVFKNNYAYFDGGAIYYDGLGSGTDGMHLTNCCFVSNSTDGYGGAISMVWNDWAVIANCVFTGNHTHYVGGAVYMARSDDETEIINCTFYNNTSDTDGAALGITLANPLIFNCILWGNTVDEEEDELWLGGPVSVFRHCDIYGCGGSGDDWDNENFGMDAGGNIDSGDDGPSFVNTEDLDGWDNAWATTDDGLCLRTDSLCIDTGDNDWIDYIGVTTDITGKPRRTNGDHDVEGETSETVDMGAYELPRIWYVDSAAGAEGNGKTWGTAFKYLQDVLDADSEVLAAGDEIWVADGTYYPDEDESENVTPDDETETFLLVSGVAVYGGFLGTETETALIDRDWANNETILSGDIGGGDNSYHVVTGVDNGVLDGFTITKGYANHASTTQYQRGAGMYNDSVSPTVSNCKFTQNDAFYGGGMYNYNCSPTVSGTVFYDNYAVHYGGGIFNLNCSTAPTIQNCIFNANLAFYFNDPYYYGCGGGIANYNSVANINKCTFFDNYVYVYGGGICSDYESSGTATNCIFWNNTASVGAGPEIALLSESNNSALSVSYSDVEGGEESVYVATDCTLTWGSGNIDVDPLFANAAGGDFHLKSVDGRWDPDDPEAVDGWVTDGVTSPCVNGGDPASNYSSEPSPNGDRINMGAYGNTPEASKSELYPFKYLLQTNDQYALPTEAAWSISGGSVNMSDLESNQIIMIPTGAYTVSFDCDNDTPYIVDAEGQSKTVTSSSVNYYTATYQACGALQISAFCPATLGYGGSAWGRFSCDEGSTWNIPYNHVPAYVKVLPDSYTIEFENYSLLSTPDDIFNVTVSAYNVVQLSGTYLLNDVYVEPVSGDDSNIGTSGSPVKTVTNAAVKVKISGTVYITNYYILFLHQVTQEYRGKINENVTLDKHVIIQYTGPSPPLHIFGDHYFEDEPTKIGVIFEYE